MSPTEIAPDDIAASREAAAGQDREPLVLVEPLRAFLDEHGLGSGEPQLSAIGEGHSNVTLLVRRGDAEIVLRRPPRGPLPPSAHDVVREATVLRAMEGHARVPRVLAVSASDDVIGAPFYVMEKVEGHVVTDEVPAAFATAAGRARLAEELVDALVEVHAVDWRACGLEGFGKPTGYLERQLRRFTGLWEHNRTRAIPAVESVGRWLGEQMPEQSEATIVHGDYRIGNVIYGLRPPPRLAAILDWEMATIGDPLADVGYLCMMWSERSDPEGGLFDLGRVTREEGFPARSELVARYEQRSGRSMSAARWYQVLAIWKAVVFMEGNYRRALAGSTDDPFLRSFGDGVIALAERAQELARGG